MTMAKYQRKDADGDLEYRRLKSDLKAGTPKNAYYFYGEERYLLEDAVKSLRAMIPAETAEFNHHRMDQRSFSLDAFSEAVDALPVFAERTLIEVRDADFGKLGDETRKGIADVLRDVPEYACVVFICPDGQTPEWRTKSAQALSELLTRVDFQRLDSRQAESWVTRNLAASGKRITRDAVSRFVLMTGGLMTNMKTEIEKLVAYSKGDAIDTRDVELLVTPVADARTYLFTDAVIKRSADRAFELMGELLRMPDVDAHSVVYALANTTRQLMIARVCVDARVSQKDFMSLASVRQDIAARNLMSAARSIPFEKCAWAAKESCETILRLNSTGEDASGAAKELTARVLLTLGVRA